MGICYNTQDRKRLLFYRKVVLYIKNIRRNRTAAEGTRRESDPPQAEFFIKIEVYMKKLTIGILAHVDAGKTTLSEAMLYIGGSIRKLGRVDKKDAFLDTYELERARGITIFSKQAQLKLSSACVTLLDTPGHVDFSSEMERTLQVLDAAVLVISGMDGVQGHTLTLWRLLKKYRIPVILFVNKMDQKGTAKSFLMEELRCKLSEGCVNFGMLPREAFYENVAMCEEGALESYLETGAVSDEKMKDLIGDRLLFPCYFGSALKLDGVEELLKGIERYVECREYGESFGARVFKISRDEQGNRLTHLKVTGGCLRTRDMLTGGDTGNGQTEAWEEKVNQIRFYSGTKYEVKGEAEAGDVCAVTGLSRTRPGEGLGAEEGMNTPLLATVLTYQIQLPEGCDPAVILPKLRQLEEEEPELHIVWEEGLKEIQAQIMGEVQTEILKSLIEERFGIKVEFGTGNIMYKETIRSVAEGVGHFEPLRHYAEVHLLLEPGEAGSGLSFAAHCSEDTLDRNWQRLVLTHLEEKQHRGVLTGAPITDMKITLAAGRAHIKHTEGGDFRQATYRALRQGLMQAESLLLEPYFDFQLEVPEAMAGRAMTDLERMHGSLSPLRFQGDTAVLNGSAPAACIKDYQKEVTAYTKGHGRMSVTLKGYEPCHNTSEIISRTGYDPDRDTENPSGSVFCAHGGGFPVSWDKVGDYMHLESCLVQPDREQGGSGNGRELAAGAAGEWIGEDEVDRILNQASFANRRREEAPRKWTRPVNRGESIPSVTRQWKKPEKQESYLLVDGYNIIFAWDELKDLAQSSIDGARGRLLDIMSNYQGFDQSNVIVVFDAYRVQGQETTMLDYGNIHVVYTKEAETADQYIEKFAHENGRKYNVTVATSDRLEQVIITGQGCRLLSARELLEETERVSRILREEFLSVHSGGGKSYLLDGVPQEELKNLLK